MPMQSLAYRYDSEEWGGAKRYGIGCNHETGAPCRFSGWDP